MDATQTTIKLDLSEWNIKLTERSRKRMKLQVKLSKDEAIAFKNFADICKPEDISNDDFLKTVFVTGIDSMNKQLADMVKEYAKENVEELASSGITVLEGNDGEIKLQSSVDLVEGQASDVSGPGL